MSLLLLDRDGTLIEEQEYLADPKRVRLLPGVPQALRRLRERGFKLAVVSNQSGVGRGLISPSQLRRVNRRFIQLLKRKNARVDGVYWCPHRPKDRCSCRKPKLGLAKRASRDLGTSWKRSVSVGDKRIDVQMGQRTGGWGVLVLTGYGRQWRRKSGADFTALDFQKAAAWILKQTRSDHGISKRKNR